MFVLTGWNQCDGELEQNFTLNERETAVAIARIWSKRGWLPCLKCYNNRSIFLVHFNHSLRVAA